MDGAAAINWIWGLGRFGSKPGLTRIKWILDQLGNPQKDLPVVHVAGTNGKGSTCHILERLLTKEGYQVGLFTSPFVESFAERIVVGSEPISKTLIGELVTEIKPLVEKADDQGLGHPTQFEVVTVLCFLYYYRMDIDLVILETGLGGRLDATNVVYPLVSVITNVGYDHMNVLGNSLPEIAREKSGIIKEKVPVVTGVNDDQAYGVVKGYAQKNRSAVYSFKDDFSYNSVSFNGSGYQFNYAGINQNIDNLWLPLLGKHQISNCSLALATLELLKEHGFNWTIDNIRVGLETVKLPVRMEYILSKGSDKPDILLDASHNPEGIESLMDGLADLNESNSWDKKVFITGILGDKQVEKMLANISTVPDEFLVTTPLNPRASDPVELSEKLKIFFPDSTIRVVKQLDKVIDEGLKSAGESGLLVIFGSFYLVAEARQILLAEKGYKA